MTMPADIRSLAQEAVDLAMVCECGHHRDAHEGHTCMVGQDPPRHCSACGCPRFESQSEAASHAGTHYATIARALIEALDRAEQYQRDWYAAKSDFGDAMAKARGEVRAITADRDALLADLPHVLETCRCPRTWLWQLGTHGKWPEAHTAAIARLEARIK